MQDDTSARIRLPKTSENDDVPAYFPEGSAIASFQTIMRNVVQEKLAHLGL